MSGFLKSLKDFFSFQGQDYSSSFITFKIKCGKCGEEIDVKVRRAADISRVYEGEGPGNAVYFLRKEILGKKCNNLIYIKVYFGPGMDIISKEITGGEFIE
jgi:hypothetical protein